MSKIFSARLVLVSGHGRQLLFYAFPLSGHVREENGVGNGFFLLLAVLCLLALPVATHSEQPEPDRGAWRTAAPAPMKPA